MNTVLVPVSDLPNSHDAVRRVVDEFRRNPAMCVHLINVRRPLSRLVIPLSRATSTWALAVAALLLVALVLGLVSEAGVHWAPASGRPGS